METITLTQEEITKVFFKWNNDYLSQKVDFKKDIDTTFECAEAQANDFIAYLNKVRDDA